jgi:hypothetical protein
MPCTASLFSEDEALAVSGVSWLSAVQCFQLQQRGIS